MIRTLQKKFVVTAMIAITALLLLLLGAINLANIILGGKVIDHTLQMIAGQAVGQEGLPQAPRDLPPRIFTQAPKNDHGWQPPQGEMPVEQLPEDSLPQNEMAGADPAEKQPRSSAGDSTGKADEEN